MQEKGSVLHRLKRTRMAVVNCLMAKEDAATLFTPLSYKEGDLVVDEWFAEISKRGDGRRGSANGGSSSLEEQLMGANGKSFFARMGAAEMSANASYNDGAGAERGGSFRGRNGKRQGSKSGLKV